MNATTLYKTMSVAELVALQERVTAVHRQRGSFFMIDPVGRSKLDAIARAITWHLADKRAAAGNPVPTCGYSGRQSNR